MGGARIFSNFFTVPEFLENFFCFKNICKTIFTLVGIGAASVGIFPENTGTPHVISALIVFICGGICAIMSFRVFPAPWAWFSGALGVITLAAIILLGAKCYLGLGAGGMERMIAYPLILWALGSGAFLMAPAK